MPLEPRNKVSPCSLKFQFGQDVQLGTVDDFDLCLIRNGIEKICLTDEYIEAKEDISFDPPNQLSENVNLETDPLTAWAATWTPIAPGNWTYDAVNNKVTAGSFSASQYIDTGIQVQAGKKYAARMKREATNGSFGFTVGRGAGEIQASTLYSGDLDIEWNFTAAGTENFWIETNSSFDGNSITFFSLKEYDNLDFGLHGLKRLVFDSWERVDYETYPDYDKAFFIGPDDGEMLVKGSFKLYHLGGDWETNKNYAQAMYIAPGQKNIYFGSDDFQTAWLKAEETIYLETSNDGGKIWLNSSEADTDVIGTKSGGDDWLNYNAGADSLTLYSATMGVLGATPVAQAAAIPTVSTGTDTAYETAINAIITAIKNFGITA